MLTDGWTDGQTDRHHQSISRNCFAIRPTKRVCVQVHKNFSHLIIHPTNRYEADFLTCAYEVCRSGDVRICVTWSVLNRRSVLIVLVWYVKPHRDEKMRWNISYTRIVRKWHRNYKHGFFKLENFSSPLDCPQTIFHENFLTTLILSSNIQIIGEILNIVTYSFLLMNYNSTYDAYRF